MKSDRYYIFCVRIIKSLKKVSTIWLSHYNNERKYNNGRKYGCDKPFQNLNKKQSIFSREKNKVRDWIKCKHGNNIYEHGKQQNGFAT